MTFQELYTESVVQIIKEKAEEKKNQIFVILGQADLIKDNWLNDNLSDSDTFLKNGSESVFNKNWFTRIFTQLNIVKDLHLLSYAQFSYLVNYIDNSFAYKRNIISDEKNFEISSNLLVSYTYDTYIQGKVINTDGASEAFIKIKQVPCTRDYGPILEDKKSPVFITKQKILNFNFYPNPVV